jgi:hypothetical protein
VFGSGPVALAATSNAPSPSFTFGTTSAGTICTVSGTSVTLVGIGPCVLTVTAAAAGNYAAVTTPVTQTLTITAAAQTIAFGGTVPASAVFGSGPVTLAATSNAPSPSFTFGTTSANAICTVSGTSIALVGIGPCVLTVTAAATSNYAAVTTAVTQTLTITAAAQTIAFAASVPASAVFGSGQVTLAATSNAPSPSFTFATTSAGTICTVSGTSLTLAGVGPCVLTVTAGATGNYAAVTTPATQTLTITAASITIVDVSSQVQSTSSGFVYSRATGTYSGTITILNIGATPIAVPIQSVFTGLTAGVTLTNGTGTVPSGPYAGAPYITLSTATPLAPGASVSFTLKFTYSGSAPVTFVSKTLSGTF